MYYGIQVNLAVANTPYNLEALLYAQDTNLRKGVTLEQFHTIILQTVGVSNVVLVGDSQLTTSRYGYSIPTTGQLVLKNTNNVFPLTDFWVQSGGTNLKLNVTLVG